MYPQTQMVFRRYRFDAFEVDTRTGVLRQGGTTISLQDIPFRFLVALLEHPGELRSRDELRNEIWPGGVNLDFEGALRTAAHKVRQALGDLFKDPHFIETIPGRGFRFIGVVAVEPVETDALTPVEFNAPGRAKRRFPVWTTTAILAGLGAILLLDGRLSESRGLRSNSAHVPTVVALPSKVFGRADSTFLTDAVPDTLSTMLGQMEGLDTKLPPTSAQVDQIQGDIHKIAEAYGADFLILTTVTAEGDRLLLNVKLAEAATQKVRWASQYDARRDNYNGLLHDAAQAVAAIMKPGAFARATGGQPAFSSFVELALREGAYFQRQYESSKDPHDFDLALAAFRKAQSLEPSSALVAAEIAGTFNEQYFAGKDPKAQAEAERWVTRALELDPRCGRAWAVRSWIEINRPKLDQAATVEYILKAVHYAPNDARTLINLGAMVPTSSFQATTGLQAMELDPLNTLGYSWAALCLASTGRAGEGVPIIERAIHIEPRQGFHTWLKYYCLFHAGRFDEARKAYSEAAWSSVSKLMRFIMDGNLEGGRTLAKDLLTKWRQEDIGSIHWVNRASFYCPLLVRLGMKEDALWVLEKSTESQFPPSYDWLLMDPDMQKLAGDRRYAKALAASRKYALLFLKHADQAQARGEYPKQLEQPLNELRALLARS